MPALWRDDAACLDHDPDLFFPTGSAAASRLQTRRASEVCAGCPVTRACLEWSHHAGADHGVFGGLNEHERRRERRRSARGVPKVPQSDTTILRSLLP